MKKFSDKIREIKESKIQEEESKKQEKYTAFFLETLKKYGVSSPAELNDEEKKKFFDEIESGWKEEK